MNILLVGGAGYLGGAVTDLLAGTQHAFRVYDSLLFEERDLNEVPFVRGDVRDRERLRPLLDWADAVVWLAALVGDRACALRPEVTREVNEDSVRWLAETFRGRIVFPSTCSVYGAREEECGEDAPTNPLSVYAETKLAAESHLADRDALVFRLGTLFGLGDRHSRIRLDLVVNALAVQALNGQDLHVHGGEQHRPLLHVRDAARAIVDGLESSVTGVFNLHKENIRVLDLARLIQRLVPGVDLILDGVLSEDAPTCRVASDRAAALLGFSPRLDVEDGVAELSVWCSSSG